MEIVPIIYKLLILAGSVLTLVVVVSYLLSRLNKSEEKKNEQIKQFPHQPMYFDHNSPQGHMQHQPVILPINALEQREINVVRKQSYEDFSRTTGPIPGPQRKNGNRRYTILNEEMKNSDYRYVKEG